MIAVNTLQKALFRKGNKVKTHYYPGVTFRVVAKEYDEYGNVSYNIESNDRVELHRGMRQKDLFKA